MNGMGKIVAAALVAALCALVIKKQVPEMAMALVLAGGALILLSVMPALATVLAYLEELTRMGGLTTAVVAPMAKVAGISIVTHTAAEVCKDAGEGGLAGFVETAGSVMALMTAIPLMSAVLSTLSGLL